MPGTIRGKASSSSPAGNSRGIRSPAPTHSRRFAQEARQTVIACVVGNHLAAGCETQWRSRGAGAGWVVVRRSQDAPPAVSEAVGRAFGKREVQQSAIILVELGRRGRAPAIRVSLPDE